MNDPVVLVPSAAEWPATFLRLRDELAGVFGSRAVAIEHIGSTAVAGLCAKPIIDIMLGARALADIEACIGAVEALGYEYVARFEAVLPDRRYFSRRAPDACHLHAVAIDSDFWRDQLAFRDALRADTALAAEYAALKQSLAARFGDDRSAYTDAKGPFIRGVVARATRAGVGKR